MTEQELNARIEALESRFMHQEAALQELTRSVLKQEQLLKQQAETVQRMQIQLRAVTATPLAAPDEETPPPHY